MKRTKKGISLIVLIITIAVIIVLASAVILSIANNRPIESAKEATKLHNETVLKENAAVLSAQWKTDSLLGNTTMSRSEYVKQGLSSQGFTEEEIGELAINEETGKIGKKGGAIDVASNPNKYYGKEVDYKENSGSGVGWKIFYADETNIYLIASDYIPYANVPNSTRDGIATSHKPYSGSEYRASCTETLISDYTGSASIDTSLQNLNSKYFKYLSDNSTTSTNENMKAVAYMLDTKAWEKFKGEDAEYAIGAPTSEIFIKSWNSKYPNLKIEYQVKDFSGYTALNGYVYKKEGTDSWKITISYAFRKSDNTYDDLYVISGSNKTDGMWLASPSISSNVLLNYVKNYDGGLMNCIYDDNSHGFRPLVCLKSSAQLQEQGSGKYAIK